MYLLIIAGIIGVVVAMVPIVEPIRKIIIVAGVIIAILGFLSLLGINASL